MFFGTKIFATPTECENCRKSTFSVSAEIVDLSPKIQKTHRVGVFLVINQKCQQKFSQNLQRACIAMVQWYSNGTYILSNKLGLIKLP